MFQPLFCLLATSVVWLLLMASSAWAGQTYVNLIMGDFNAKMAVDAIKAIRHSQPELVDEVHFQVVSGRTADKVLAEGTAGRLPPGAKGIALLNIMDSRMVANLMPYIQRMIRSGVRVYAVGGSYGTEQRELGLINDEIVNAYQRENGLENITQMLRFLLQRDCGLKLDYRKPVSVPQTGIYLKQGRRSVTDFEEYRQLHQERPGPWIGIVFHKTSLDNGDMALVDTMIDALERAGLNVLPVYGYPSELAVERFMFDGAGRPRVQAVIGISLKVGVVPQRAIPILSRLGVPVIDAITLNSQSREEWERSPLGLDTFERGFQVGLPELAGVIQPTVVASKEQAVDPATGLEYLEVRPIPERINRLTERIKRWLALQQKPNSLKKIALIYYNYPPGKQNIGACYLNVLPESLYEIITRLQAEGYDTGSGEITRDRLFEDIRSHGRNIGNWAPAAIDRMARSGQAVLIPMETYKRWFATLPDGFRRAVLHDWGKPEESRIMVWRSANGKKYFVIPALRYGNIVFTPQPSRGWEQDVKKLYHDTTIAPHHQYIAFYLWLKHEFKADAVAHIGTHGTHEWLSGKEVGFTAEDPPELLIQDLPNIYPYIVDDVGEGLQAKRRGMGVVIDYMTPPFDKAGMNPELKELSSLISDYNGAREKSSQLAIGKLEEINDLARKEGILTDLKLAAIATPEQADELDDYIREIGEKITPFGLHTFGKSPDDRYCRSTAEAILSIEKGLTAEERAKRLAALEADIIKSGPCELDSFVAALAGKYIPSGIGNDPIRNPESLPTGKNFYAFDPSRIPSSITYATGEKLAKELIEGYKKRHGSYPDKLTFNLWGTETIRNEGVMESQVMYLMGVRPKWDERGRVTGVEAIPRRELGRGRIDVTMVPSGLYRDLFSNLMALLDSAVTVARDQDEGDNLISANVKSTKRMLMEKGMSEEKAQRLASVRIFTEQPGSYGTGIDKVIVASNSWHNEKQVVDVYFKRLGHPFGQGFWGEKTEYKGEDLGVTLFKNALSGSKMAVHSRSGNLIATLDNDDFFQYLGGTVMAIRAVDGKSPEVYVTTMSNPKQPKQESLEKVMGMEMRSRYLNPEWIKAMMKEEYSGARFVDKVTEHLWGWQVTVPEAVDGAKWQEMYETYIQDKYGLGIKELFRKAKNMWAYQSVAARMLETVRKGYWKPNKKVVEVLAEEYAESVQEVGLACCDHTCNNPQLTSYTVSTLLSVPGLRPLAQGFMKALDTMKKTEHGQYSPARRQQKGTSAKSILQNKGLNSRAPDGKGAAKAKAGSKSVEGLEMQEVGAPAGAAFSAPIPWIFILGFILAIGLVALGFKRR